MPVGRWVRRTAESVVLTCWPPAPEDLKVSTRRSSLRVSILSTSYSSGSVPIDAELTIATVTPTTFTADIPSLGGTITGNVSVRLPIDICFYLVNVGTVSNTNQFFPLFVSSVEAVGSEVVYSLTDKEDLPFINHPVVQAGTNMGSANSNKALKSRGLMLKRGQALYAAVSGSTALTNGFYVGVQGGFY